MRTLALVLLVLAVGACGRVGPLRLPDDRPPPPVEQDALQFDDVEDDGA